MPKSKPAPGALSRASKHLLLMLAAGTLLAATGCGTIAIDCASVEFSSLAKTANRLRIANRNGEAIRESKDSANVAALLHFISARQDNWCRPQYETPVGWIGAELYADETLLDTINVGPTFIGVGSWRIRTIDQAERQELFRILAIEDPYAKAAGR